MDRETEAEKLLDSFKDDEDEEEENTVSFWDYYSDAEEKEPSNLTSEEKAELKNVINNAIKEFYIMEKQDSNIDARENIVRLKSSYKKLNL